MIFLRASGSGAGASGSCASCVSASAAPEYSVDSVIKKWCQNRGVQKEQTSIKRKICKRQSDQIRPGTWRLHIGHIGHYGSPVCFRICQICGICRAKGSLRFLELQIGSCWCNWTPVHHWWINSWHADTFRHRVVKELRDQINKFEQSLHVIRVRKIDLRGQLPFLDLDEIISTSASKSVRWAAKTCEALRHYETQRISAQKCREVHRHHEFVHLSRCTGLWKQNLPHIFQVQKSSQTLELRKSGLHWLHWLHSSTASFFVFWVNIEPTCLSICPPKIIQHIPTLYSMVTPQAIKQRKNSHHGCKLQHEQTRGLGRTNLALNMKTHNFPHRKCISISPVCKAFNFWMGCTRNGGVSSNRHAWLTCPYFFTTFLAM